MRSERRVGPAPRTERVRLGAALAATALLLLLIASSAGVPIPVLSSIARPGHIAHPVPAPGPPAVRPPPPPPPTQGPPPNGSPPPGTAGRFSLGGLVGRTSSDFWGVVVQTAASTGITSEPALGAYLNSTPFTWFSYTLNTDACNMTTDSYYGNNGQVTHPCPFNVTAFAAWCHARGPSCQSILKLPGENNNSAEDAAMAEWIVQKVGFQPTYWTIGNEPMLWKHYGIPWSEWRSTDHSVPTPIAYAYDARAAISAVRAVDPGARFIGIESDCECSAKDYMAAVARVDGPNLSAVGYHTYPSTALLTNETLTQFFAPLTSDKNLSTSLATVRSAIGPQCPNCSTLPIFVTEYNGTGRGATQWAGTYADAAFLAASTAQALTLNVTMFLIYNLQSESPPNASTRGWGLLGFNGSVDPEGLLYTTLFAHFAQGEVHAAHVVTAVGNVWAVVSSNQTASTILIVNANVTESLALSTGSLPGGGSSVTSTTLWNMSLAAPATASGAPPATITLPPLGMVEFTLSWVPSEAQVTHSTPS